jgi:hypothetical protein
MKTQAKGIRIQAKTAKCKNGENLKFMADSGSMQQFSKLATGRSWHHHAADNFGQVAQKIIMMFVQFPFLNHRYIPLLANHSSDVN